MFTSTESKPVPSSEGLTILAAGLTVTGDIETVGVIRIEGVVEGSIRADGRVLVGAGGLVKGDIHTRTAVIGGRVVGSLTADERVEIEDGALVEGDLTAPRLVVHEGGDINGRVMMTATEAVKLNVPEEPQHSAPAALVAS